MNTMKVKPLQWTTVNKQEIRAKTTNHQYFNISIERDNCIVSIINYGGKHVGNIATTELLKEAKDICEGYHRFTVKSSFEFIDFKEDNNNDQL